MTIKLTVDQLLEMQKEAKEAEAEAARLQGQLDGQYDRLEEHLGTRDPTEAQRLLNKEQAKLKKDTIAHEAAVEKLAMEFRERTNA